MKQPRDYKWGKEAPLRAHFETKGLDGPYTGQGEGYKINGFSVHFPPPFCNDVHYVPFLSFVLFK